MSIHIFLYFYTKNPHYEINQKKQKYVKKYKRHTSALTVI